MNALKIAVKVSIVVDFELLLALVLWFVVFRYVFVNKRLCVLFYSIK